MGETQVAAIFTPVAPGIESLKCGLRLSSNSDYASLGSLGMVAMAALLKQLHSSFIHQAVNLIAAIGGGWPRWQPLNVAVSMT
jgi:hypothetical protein